MRLSADILGRELAKQYRVTMGGSYENRLTLMRPQFYMDGEDSFLTDHLYLATVEHLPRRPKIQRGAVLVCIGESLNMKYYEERLCLITIHNKADFFKVYQALQNIFDQYDEWERSLYRALVKGDGIAQMIEDSAPVFEKPLIVLDASFHAIAYSAGVIGQEMILSEGGSLGNESLSQFLSASDMMIEKHGALRIEIGGNHSLCVNLFDRSERYSGCLCVLLGEEEFTSGKEKLAEFLAKMIETAEERNPQYSSAEKPSLKSVMRTLIDEQPISQAQRLILNGANHQTSWYCAILRHANKKNRIPAGYICDSLEEKFPGSIALDDHDLIVCFMKKEEKMAKKAVPVSKQLEEFASRMKLTAGISDDFSDLFDIRIHYTQALCALENGSLLNPEKMIYTFEEYALSELILNSLGDLPAEAYFPEGLGAIISHDEEGGVSYLETLKVFLEENLSYTSTARRLYIHRSTLIDRIARIEKELGFSLKDPSRRLLIEIVLKAMEIEKTIHAK